MNVSQIMTTLYCKIINIIIIIKVTFLLECIAETAYHTSVAIYCTITVNAQAENLQGVKFDS